MGRRGVLALVGVGSLLLGGVLFRVFSRSSSGTERAGAHQAPEIRPRTALGRASEAEMPKVLAGVYLDMDEAQLQAVRAAAKRHEPADSEAHYVFTEALGRPGKALYLFSRSSHRLARVQLAQQLGGVNDLSPRIDDLQGHYGPMTGVWDCPPAPGQLPTRRFTWLRGPVGVMDVVLLLGEQVAATLYVGPRDDILTSLAQAGCTPTPPERFSTFPAVPASTAD